MISGTIDPALMAYVRAVASAEIGHLAAVEIAQALERLPSDTIWAIAALADITTDSRGTEAIRRIADAAGYGQALDVAMAVIAGDVAGDDHSWVEYRSALSAVPVVRCSCCGRVAVIYHDGDREWLAGSCPSAAIRESIKERKEQPA